MHDLWQSFINSELGQFLSVMGFMAVVVLVVRGFNWIIGEKDEHDCSH